VWSLVGCLHDFYQGASLVVWLNQHILGHHVYTNIDGADPDIVTAATDVRRITWDQTWLPRYFYQHIYTPLLYCVLGLKTRIQDIYILYISKNGMVLVV
jgi:fatty acid desaturase